MFVGVVIAPLTDYNGWRQSKEGNKTANEKMLIQIDTSPRLAQHWKDGRASRQLNGAE